MFNLSFHCISKYEVRIYLFLDGFGTRFFINDITDYLLKFFEPNQSLVMNKILSSKTSNSLLFQSQLSKCKNILNDDRYNAFNELILNSSG